MKICIVIPNDDWRKTAGVRIRYDRIAPAVRAQGHEFELLSIDRLDSTRAFEADLYIFSKCYDARAPLLAQLLKDHGARVGADFFDDYFSQQQDSGFVHLRRWFHTLVPLLDFAICSTGGMRDLLARLAPDLSCHVVNDPAGRWDRDTIADALERNLQRCLQTGVVNIGWFGIGDNPHFSLGLEDLQAFAPMLARCRAAGFTPDLRILTNPRALSARRLEMLARLPVPTRLEEWSEAREQALIADSLFCFLPVNAQGFSTVKSLNRAVSVLTGGAQVLSAGYPLYDPLGAFVYRDITTLLADARAGQMKLRRDSLKSLTKLLEGLGSARVEADRLLRFLGQLPDVAAERAATPTENTDQPAVAAVLHGLRSNPDVHKQAQKLGCLSVATPMALGKLFYDVHPVFDPAGTFVEVTLSVRAQARLRPSLRDQARPGQRPDGKEIYTLRLERAAFAPLRPVAPVSRPPQALRELARYDRDMALSAQLLEHLFGPGPRVLSELSPPYWTSALTGETSADAAREAQS